MNSADYARTTTITFDEWCKRLSSVNYKYKNTNWYKAGLALEAETHPPPVTPPPTPPGASRAKYMLFAAQEPQKALATPAKYGIAFSADQAYRSQISPALVQQYRSKGHRVCGWCDCRTAGGTPAAAGVLFVHDFDLDYFIGQAESAAEFDNALSVGATVVIGNITSLRQDQITRIETGEVLFIQEDYWNEGWARSTHPAISAYCAGIYATQLWNPQIQNYKDAERWREGDGLYHVAAVEDWANLPA